MDQDLVQSAQRGDRSAFVDLVRPRLDRCFALAHRILRDDAVPGDDTFWGLAGVDERMRVFVLDDGDGSNVVITVDAVDPATFDRLVAAALPVLETFRFET